MEQKVSLQEMRRQLTRRYYQELTGAEAERRKVVWMPAGGPPPEILYAMDILPCFPENYATIAAAKQEAKGYCEVAEARRYSLDLCSYSRCGLGMMFENRGPYGAMPQPAVILGNNYACVPHALWFETVARYWKAPFFLWEGFHTEDRPSERQLQFMTAGLKKLISFLEEHTGKKLDWDKLKEAVWLSYQAHELWHEVQELRKAVPCPIGAREMSSDIFFLVVMSGTRQAVDYYTRLRDEVKERVQKRIGEIAQEKYRLAYVNIPLWYNLKLFDYFAERRAIFVHENYTSWMWIGWSWEEEFDPDKPLESLALYRGSFWHLWDVEKRIRKYLELIEPYHIDGAVFFSNRSCKPVTLGQYDLARTLREIMNVPSMEFEAEMADPRSFPEAQVKAKADIFLELIAQRKGER